MCGEFYDKSTEGPRPNFNYFTGIETLLVKRLKTVIALDHNGIAKGRSIYV
jgi:hypothetical protein